MSDDFKVMNWGTNKIALLEPKNGEFVELRPTELHMRENGTLDDRPSLTFVLESEVSPLSVYAHISLDMLNHGLMGLGYEIIPRDER